MSIPDSLTLRKAVKIATKIERLQEKLHALLGDTLELQRYGRAMKVNEILIGLEHDNYIWTAKNPRQTLYVRIGKLAGVKKVDEGLYIAEALVDASPVGILPESVAPVPSENYAAPSEGYVPTSESFSAPSEPASY